MSVLIKGMKMPEDCFLCPCIEYEHPGYVCWITGYQAHHNERPIGCPLVEVPTPHGRLIDADALDVIGYCGIPQEREDTFDDGVMWLAEQIDLLPTIIPAEECE